MKDLRSNQIIKNSKKRIKAFTFKYDNSVSMQWRLQNLSSIERECYKMNK